MEEDYRVCYMTPARHSKVIRTRTRTLEECRQAVRNLQSGWPGDPVWIECISNPNVRISLEPAG